MRPIAYEGQESYIFISYAHKDSEQVFHVLDALGEKGYRIWYDDGIAPGSEWPEDIARHLDGAEMVIAFITPASMASRNCRREINFALSKEKPFLSVFLEKTEMPLGMEMQLSAQQSILRYNCANEEDFISKILRCPEIEPCKIPDPVPEEKAAETPFYTPSPVSDGQPAGDAFLGTADGKGLFDETEAALQHSDVQEEPGPATAMKTEMPSEAAQPRELVPADTGKKSWKPDKLQKQEKKTKTAEEKQTEEKTGKKPGKKIPFIPILIGALVAACAIFFLLKQTGVKTSWGKKIDSDETSVFITNEVVTQADLEGIFRLKKLKSLTFNNCDLTACDFSRVKFASKQIYSLDLGDNTGINDFGFLSGLTLDYLYLEGCSAFSDLSLIDTSSLTGLSLDGTGVTDLSSLAGSEIMKLSFADTAVSDLSFASQMPHLYSINGAGSGVTSLLPLAGIEGLTSINFDGCALKELPDQMEALKLEEVYLSDCGLTDVGLLKNCTILEKMDLSNNPGLKDTGDLFPRNSRTLAELNISGTGIGEEGLDSLSECTGMTCLLLSGVQTDNLSFLAKMTGLVTLRAENCGIKDISALRSLIKLKILLLSFNEINDITPVGHCIKPVKSETIVDLSFNPVSSISALPAGEGYHTLLLHGTDDKIALTLKSGITAYTISVPWCEGILNTVLGNKGAYGEIYLIDCPATEKLNAQDAFGSVYCYFVSEKELMEKLVNNELSYHFNINYSYPYSVFQSR